jgi:anhydro-N-acetylmuramic acid kinase
VAEFLHLCRGARKKDVVATATALTARSIADAVRKFVVNKNPTLRLRSGQASPGTREKWRTQRRFDFQEIILSGGGARNGTLVGMIAEQLAPMGIVMRFSDEFGLPSGAKEAVAFALLAYETWNRRPSNVPSATGASRPVVLGKISYA